MKDIKDFMKREMPNRPILTDDPPQESIVVRRGEGPKVLEGIELKNGEVLGKIGGIVRGITPSTETSQTSVATEIEPSQTKVVYAVAYSNFQMLNWILDIESGTTEKVSFQLNTKVLTDLSDISFTIFGKMGNKIPITFSFNEITELSYNILVTNNYNSVITVHMRTNK